MLSGKESAVAETARRLAWEQPYLERVRNSSLVESPCVDNTTGLSNVPKLWVCMNVQAVDECSGGRRRYTVRYIGGNRSKNAGMSNEKAGENPARRKYKVSWVKVVFPGLAGP